MREVSVDTAAEMIEGGAYALDVREREEFAGGHVPGAVNIPMGQLTGRLDEVDRDRPVATALELASGAAAVQVGRKGAVGAIPTRAEAEAMLGPR